MKIKIIGTIFLVLWQLPQEILGAILYLLFAKKKKVYSEKSLYKYYYKTKQFWGISLAHFVILGERHCNDFTIKHEKGHQIQSLLFGPLYLLLIGLPSISFNIYDMIKHKGWNVKKRIRWYYNLPWEKGANILGGTHVNELLNI